MTCSGDKTRQEASSGCFLKTFEAILELALPSLAHDLERGIQSRSDLLVLKTLGRVKQNFGAYYFAIW